MDLGDKVDKGARIVWYGVILCGLTIAVIGGLWFMDRLGYIDIDLYMVCAVILVMGGIGLVGLGMWLRSLLKL